VTILASYEQASGLSWDDCFFLGQRYDEAVGFQPEESENWILSVRPSTGAQPVELKYQGGTTSWYVGLWRSPAGKCWVADITGQVHANSDLWAPDASAHWEDHRLDTPLNGVWGLDDRCVFAWGATFDEDYRVFRYDGTRWGQLPTPGFDVRSMHGISPDFVYAVGVGGRIARWDGARWTEPSSPVAENLVSVFVSSPDELYACGAAGALLEGSSHGWGVITTAPLGQLGMPLHAVAKWKGELWIGGGAQGLFKRVGSSSQLDLIKPNVHATSLDARKDLVIGTNIYVAGTSDGQNFKAAGINSLQDARAGRRLGDVL
jgi:hypothetical protein